MAGDDDFDTEMAAMTVARAVLRCDEPSAEPSAPQIEIVRIALERYFRAGADGAMSLHEAAER